MSYRRVRNWQSLSVSIARQFALKIVEKGLESADPYSAVIEAMKVQSGTLGGSGKKIVVGFGKASYRMAQACEDFLRDQISAGAIIVPKGSFADGSLSRIRVLEGTHPIPSKLSLRSTRQVLSLVRNLAKEDVVICLISGGGSALFALPKDGITLSDKQEMTRLLLAAGASIQETNTVRKHISAVKGGQLARIIAPAKCLSLILSDVVGDDISSIASGPTAPDSSTYDDAWAVLEKYNLVGAAPKSIIEHIKSGLAARVPENPKPGDSIFMKVENLVVANNTGALSAMTKKAERLELNTLVMTSRQEGEAKEVGKRIGVLARQIVKEGKPIKPPCAVLFGGETTVTVKGKGKGGRNQEVALSAAISLKGLHDVAFISIGSDGIDGNTDAAGAIVDGGTVDHAFNIGLADKFLDENDSNTFLEAKEDCLVRTGPTGTNVNDLAVLVVLQ